VLAEAAARAEPSAARFTAFASWPLHSPLPDTSQLPARRRAGSNIAPIPWRWIAFARPGRSRLPLPVTSPHWHASADSVGCVVFSRAVELVRVRDERAVVRPRGA
jgi:hypothetical protein